MLVDNVEHTFSFFQVWSRPTALFVRPPSSASRTRLWTIRKRSFFFPSSLLSRTIWSHNEIGRFYLTTEVQIRTRTRAADSLFKVTTLKRTSIVWRTEKDGERNEWDRVLENSSDTPLRIQYVLSMTTRNPFRWSALPILSFRPSTDDQLHPPFGTKKKTVALLISTIVVLGLSAHLFSVLADPARSECQK